MAAEDGLSGQLATARHGGSFLRTKSRGIALEKAGRRDESLQRSDASP
jgi:hypothetical protein